MSKIHLKYTRFIFFASLLFSIQYMTAQTRPVKSINNSDNEVLPLDPAVRYGKLPNGFTYYIRHNEEPKGRVLMYLVNKAGSILEDEDQRGLAHFMEHMNFNGTKHFPHNELVNYLQKIGVRFGADLNAYTSFDETVFELPVPSDKPELVKSGLEVMRDWAQEATLDPGEIDAERGVVLEEKRLGKGAQERMSRQYYPMLLNHSRYAERFPIGLDTVLNNFKRPTIYKFYHDWYRPDLQALIVVGDIDVNQIEKAIRSSFSDLKNPVNERPRPTYTVSLTGKNQFMAVTDKEMPATQMVVYIKSKAQLVKTESDYRRAIDESLINIMLKERLNELGQAADAPFIGGQAGFSGFLGGLNTFAVSVSAKPGELERGFKAAWREIQRAKQFGFTITELDRAKADYLEEMNSELKEKSKLNSVSYVKEYQQNFLQQTAAPGIVYEYNLVKRNLPGINLDGVNYLLKTAIKETDRDVLVLAPDKAKNTLPDEAAFASWIKSVAQETLSPYIDEVSKKPFLITQPSPGKIVSEQKNDQLNVITYTLSNGIKVLVKKTDYKNDEVNFRGFSNGGTSLYPDSVFHSAQAVNTISMYLGAGNYSPSELKKYDAGKKMGVGVSVDARRQLVVAQTTNQDLQAALELTYARITEPRKDTSLFKAEIGKERAVLGNRGNSPEQVFHDTVIAVMTSHKLRDLPLTPEGLDKINLDKAFEVYKERFADESGFTFVFVGSIDTLILKPLLEKYIASLPATYKVVNYKELYHYPTGVIERIVYKGTEPKATVLMNFTGTFPYGYSNNLKLDALREVLLIRLTERLREQESEVYSPQVSAGASKLGGEYFNFEIGFGCAPQNVNKLIASTLDEINKLKTNGPTQTNLDKYKTEAIRKLETDQQTNSYWENYLIRQLQDKEDLDEVFNYKNAINAITIEDVRQMAEGYLTGKNFIKLILMPETAKPDTTVNQTH